MWEFLAGLGVGAALVALFLPRDLGMSWTVQDAQAGRDARLLERQAQQNHVASLDRAERRRARNMERARLPLQVFNGQRNYLIRYEDSDGNMTERIISVHSIEQTEPLLLRAWCHLRKGDRSFFPERMVDCIDHETGEIIQDPVRWFAQMPGSPD